MTNKSDAERIREAQRYTPATYASLLGTLISHPDFEGIERTWEGEDCSWVVTLWPQRRWRYYTPPKPNLMGAILEALQYLENPIEPK